MAYEIRISEDQRAILVSALNRYPKTEEEEVLLLDLLKALPEDEAAAPGYLHSFID